MQRYGSVCAGGDVPDFVVVIGTPDGGRGVTVVVLCDVSTDELGLSPANTHELSPAVQCVDDVTVLPDRVVTRTAVGWSLFGHHAKYQPLTTVASTVLPSENTKVAAAISAPARPKMCSSMA